MHVPCHPVPLCGHGSDGQVLWTQKYNGNADQDDLINSVAIDPSGNIYAAGLENVTGQSQNAWLRKYAP